MGPFRPRPRTASPRMNWSALLDEQLGPDAAGLLPPAVKLPALPHAATEFVRRSKEPDADAAELGALIGTDAALTAALLKRVNSSAAGLRGTVGSTAKAVALLGSAGVRLFVLTEAVKLAADAAPGRLIEPRLFWTMNLERALFAREIAALLGADPDVSFAGALLQDFLLPALTDAAFDAYVSFLAAHDAARPAGGAVPPGLPEWETATFGLTHAAAAACAMRSWGFPDELAAAALLHHRGLKVLADPALRSTPAAAVAVSALLPDVLHQSPGGLTRLLTLQSRWPPFDLAGIAQRVKAALGETAPPAENHLPLADRLERRGAA